MKRITPYTLLAGVLFSFIPTAFAEQASLVVTPPQVIQGEPFLAQVQGVASTTDIQSISFNGAPVKIFTYKNMPSAFVAVPLEHKPGDYPLLVTLASGQTIQKSITIGARERQEITLGIPAKLGGNTPASAKKLVNNLSLDNKRLANLYSNSRMLWRDAFMLPVASSTITNAYGYIRQTNGYSIAHKGTDFRASIGTPVMAMNRGVVRDAHTYTTYGKTVVIDHGLGVFTYYMHLSKIKVSVGQLVTAGQVIGLSGDTGYSEGPHLHMSVHVGGVSIDPMKFLALLN